MGQRRQFDNINTVFSPFLFTLVIVKYDLNLGSSINLRRLDFHVGARLQTMVPTYLNLGTTARPWVASIVERSLLFDIPYPKSEQGVGKFVQKETWHWTPLVG